MSHICDDMRDVSVVKYVKSLCETFSTLKHSVKESYSLTKHTHCRTSTIYTPILPCRSRHVDSAAFTSSWFFFLSIERTHRPLFHHLPLHCFTVLNYSLNARKFASVGVSVCIRIAEFSDVIKQTFACLKQTNARLFYVRRQNAAFLRFLVFVLCLSLLA